mmetsp:Transcript_22669/g.64357  ORF Transcript_22669/g.64357 Transcript_22669/m.64357 type:complete len:206 (-) Transcript_22669:790-1407(-)
MPEVPQSDPRREGGRQCQGPPHVQRPRDPRGVLERLPRHLAASTRRARGCGRQGPPDEDARAEHRVGSRQRERLPRAPEPQCGRAVVAPGRRHGAARGRRLDREQAQRAPPHATARRGASCGDRHDAAQRRRPHEAGGHDGGPHAPRGAHAPRELPERDQGLALEGPLGHRPEVLQDVGGGAQNPRAGGAGDEAEGSRQQGVRRR